MAVIATNVSSLPEVVGSAGILVSPTDVEEMGKAMLTLLTDPDQRQELAQSGQEQAKLFSWERAAKETLQLYKSLELSPSN